MKQIIFHCVNCNYEFLVRQGSDKITLEPCPKCKTPSVRAFPEALDVETTNFCPCSCSVCPRGSPDYKRPLGTMNNEVFGRIVKEIRYWNSRMSGTVKLVWGHIAGEPLADKNIVSRINALAEAGVGSVVISTNAVPLTEELGARILDSKLHRIILSVDGVSKEIYESIRVGANYEQVQENVDKFLARAKQYSAAGRRIPQIHVQILKLNENQGEWLKFVQRYTGKKLRTVMQKGRQYRDIPGLIGGKVFLKTVEGLAGQIDAEKHVGWDGADKRRFTCTKPFLRASIWWDGRVPNPACCYSHDEGPTLGTLVRRENGTADSIHGVWLGKAFWNVRRELLKFQKSEGKEGKLPPLCKNC